MFVSSAMGGPLGRSPGEPNRLSPVSLEPFDTHGAGLLERFMSKMFRCGLPFALPLAGSSAVCPPTGSATPPATVDPTMLPYATPGILAKLPGGRVIHLKCMGSGSPTVIL